MWIGWNALQHSNLSNQQAEIGSQVVAQMRGTGDSAGLGLDASCDLQSLATHLWGGAAGRKCA
ncbi:MAG: hypothetical protein KDB23_03590 [Planctomycetales bacterium]|nr:hypothetical protein [Planctomycetales bacterium]